MTAPTYRFFDLHVLRTRHVSPAVVRVTLGGQDLAVAVTGGRDQRFKLFLPHPGQPAPVLPDDRGEGWFAQWRTQDPSVRAVMRTYTVRELRRDERELDVDFALHAPGGPACDWARTARPGDRVAVLGPITEDNGGVDFRLPDGTDWVLLTGDTSALPAVAGILASLPAGIPAKVWIEVPQAEDVQDLPTPADAEITWLVGQALLPALRAAPLPPGTPYAWLAGEAGTVRATRRHLIADRGFGKHTVTFTGYWRHGATEEDLLAELA
ncbi:siderophore-interacting protein [Streptomyces sp. NPDC049577]|uniref:siderophore-interacting protein n=1 Tax=Streptomyces sp. NPDC049577 TaxID=3155153 RepID=UPI003447AE7E